MKLAFNLALAAATSTPGTTKEFWPANNAYQGVVCGSVTEFAIAANQTCTIELNKGNAAFINAGGLLSTSASNDKRTFTVHNQLENDNVRFMVLYDITKTWYKQGKTPYPQIWELECFTAEDAEGGLSPASISCADSEDQSGIYIMGFNTNYSGDGVQNMQVYKPNGFEDGDMVSFNLRNKESLP